MTDDFFIRLERQLEAAELRELSRAPALRRLVSARRLLAASLAPAGAVGVVVVVLAVLVSFMANGTQRPRPVATAPAPGKEVGVVTNVGWDVKRGVHFGLNGRVLTVELLPPVLNQTFETVSGARISATCGETTLTRRWPAGRTSMTYRFPRDVSSSCRLEDQSGSIVASVSFRGASPGAREQVTETANNYARLFASSLQACNAYTSRTACEQVPCQRAGETPRQGCTPSKKTRQWAATFRDATVQEIAISGDRAGVMLSNHATFQLQRIATGEWLIDKFGPW